MLEGHFPSPKKVSSARAGGGKRKGTPGFEERSKGGNEKLVEIFERGKITESDLVLCNPRTAGGLKVVGEGHSPEEENLRADWEL